MTIRSEPNFQFFEILPGASFHLRHKCQPEAAKAERLLWVKVVPPVNVLWLSVSHSVERDMTLNQLTDSAQTPHLSTPPAIIAKIKSNGRCGLWPHELK